MDHTDPTELLCKGKLAFDVKKEADTAANVAQYQRGIQLKSYRCRHCSLWHLSSQPADDD